MQAQVSYSLRNYEEVTSLYILMANMNNIIPKYCEIEQCF